MDVRTSTRFRRERSAVPSARAFVDHALRAAEAPPDAIEAVVLAVAEACNNAILHAGSAFTVTVIVEGGRASVSVADDGHGFTPPVRPEMPVPQAVSHRGLALMAALVDHVDVISDESGTTVVLTQSFGTAVGDAAAAALAVDA
jgi:serine/threonine-protein kinase RsbW